MLNNYKDFIITLAPVAYYRLGEATGSLIVDEVGGFNGTYFGSPTLASPSLLPFDNNSSVSLDGTDDYLQTAVAPSVNAYSISLLVKPELAGVTSSIIRAGDGTKQIILQLNASNLFNFYHYNGSIIGACFSEPITVGTTYHITLVFDGTTNYLYVNGVLVDSAVGAVVAVSQNYQVGRNGVNLNEYYTGGLDELAFFDKTLTASQVAELYLESIAYTGITRGTHDTVVNALNPLAYYRLGEASGTVAADETGNYNGTYVGTPTLGATGLVPYDVDSAVTFDGVDDHVVTPVHPQLTSFSLIFNKPSQDDVAIIGRGTTSDRWMLYYYLGLLRLYKNDGVGADLLSFEVADENHLVVSETGGVTNVYLNGVLVGNSTSNPISSLGVTAQTTLAKYPDSNFGYADIELDEVSIFNTALTEEQVKSLYFSSVLDTSIPTSSPFSSNLASLNPLAYYRLGEASGTIAVDQTGNYNGTYVGSPTLGAVGLVPNSSDTAVSFDGVDDYVVTSSVDNNSLNSVTAVFTTTNQSQFQAVVTGGNTITERWLIYIHTDNTLRLQGGGVELVSDLSVSSNTTYHIAVTANNGDTELFVNGIKVSTQSSWNMFLSTNAGVKPCYVGVWDYAGAIDGYFHGTIDEVAIFNNSLTGAQVRELYYTFKTSLLAPDTIFLQDSYDSQVISDNPVAYWPLQETTGELLLDETNNQHLLDVVGNPLVGAVGFVTNSDKAIEVGSGSRLFSESVDLSGFATKGTIEFWMKVHNQSVSTDRLFVLGRDIANEDTIILSTVGATNEIRLGTFNYGGLNTGYFYTPNDWFHVTITRDGDTWSILINGRDYGEVTIASPVTHSEIYFGDTGQGTSIGSTSVSHIAVYDYIVPNSHIRKHIRLGVRDFTNYTEDTFEIYTKELNPSAYWRLAETKGLLAVDEVDNYHGTFNLATTRNTNTLVPASTLPATTFPGSRSFSIGKYLRFENNQPFTISCVVRMSSYGSDSSLITSGDGTKGYALYTTSIGEITLYLINTWTGNAIQVTTANSSVIPLNTPVLITVTYNGSSLASGVAIYVNSINQNTTTLYDNLTGTLVHDFPVQVGQNGVNGQYYIGDLSDITLFAKELSVAQVTDQYKAYLGHTPYWTPKEDSVQSAIVALSPVSYYPLDETTGADYGLDRVGNNHLVVEGSSPFGAENIIPSTGSTSGDFTVSNSLNGGDVHDIGYGDLSLVFAFNARNVSTTSGLITKRASTASDGEFGIYLSSNNLRVYLDRVSNTAISVNETVQVGKDYIVVVVFDVAGNTISLYLNGILSAQLTNLSIAGSNNDTTKPFRVGAFTGATENLATNLFDGRISDIAIFDKALTATEVKSITDLRFPTDSYERVIQRKNPVAYWPLSDTSGKLEDIIGQRNMTNNGLSLGVITPYEGTGVSSNGSSSYGLVQSLPTIGYNAYTVECWVSHVEVDLTLPLNFISNSQGNSRTYLYFSGGGYRYPNTYIATATDTIHNTPEDNVWFHAAMVRRADAQTYDLYIDGAKVADEIAAATPEQLVSSSLISIGAYYTTSPALYCEAKFQHLALYDRALTQEEILQNYSKLTGISYTYKNPYEKLLLSSTPFSYYLMGETTGTELTEVITGDNLTAVNGTIATLADSNRIPGQDSSAINFNQTAYFEGSPVRALGRKKYFSVSAVITLDTLGSDQDIVGNVEGNGYAIRVTSTNQLQGDARLGDGAINSRITGNTVLTTNTPYLVTFTLSGSVLSLYLNGLLDQQGTEQGKDTIYVNSTPVLNTVGAQYSPSTNSNLFSGRISNLAFYDTALTDGEILNQYLTYKENYTYTLNNYTRLLDEQGATVILDPTYTSQGYGKNTVDWSDYELSGEVRVVDGVSDQIPARAHSTALQEYYQRDGKLLDFVDQFTMDSWFKLPSQTITHEQSGGPGFYKQTSPNNLLGFHPDYVTNRVFAYAFSYQTEISPTSADLTQWNHALLTYSAGTITGYWNGKQTFTATVSSIAFTNGTFLLGSDYITVAGRYFEGELGTFSLSNKSITAEQVHRRYATGVVESKPYHLTMAKAGLRHLWSLETDAEDRITRDVGSFQSSLRPTLNSICNDFDYAFYPAATGDSVDVGNIDTATLNDHQIVIECVITLEARGSHKPLFMDGTNTDGYAIGVDAGLFGIFVRSGSTLYSCTVSDQIIPLNKPIHVIAKLSKQARQLYVDGKLLASDTTFVSNYNATATSVISGRSPSGQSPITGTTSTAYSATWAGYIAFIAIYSDYDYFTESKVLEHLKASGVAVSDYQAELLNLGAVLHFPVDSEATKLVDRVGNVNTLVRSGYTRPTTTEGKLGNGLSFDGTNSFGVATANTSHLNLLHSFSVSFWVYIDSYPTSTISTLFAKFADGMPYEVICYIKTDGTIAIDNKNGAYVSVPSTAQVPLGQWVHIVATIDANHYANIYLDNVQVASGQLVVTTTGSTGDLTFGTHSPQYTPVTAPLTGKLDEIAWFNKELSPTEINTLYESYSSKYAVSGTVTEKGTPVSRTVHVHRRDTGELVAKLNSDQVDGSFQANWNEANISDQYYVVVFDDELGTDLEAIVHDKLVPFKIN